MLWVTHLANNNLESITYANFFERVKWKKSFNGHTHPNWKYTEHIQKVFISPSLKWMEKNGKNGYYKAFYLTSKRNKESLTTKPFVC